MDCSKNGGIDAPWEENEARDLLNTGERVEFHRVSNLKVRNNARAEGGNRATTAGRNLSLLKVETIGHKRLK